MSLPRPVQIVLRVALGLAFLWAGGDKLLHPDEFAPLLVSYRLLPLSTVNLIVFWLPVCQVLIALCLLAGVWTRAATLLFCGLMAVFMLGLAQALARGIELHCGCF
ncbi:MAG: DoxX family membrane protein, partial [candidate division WS1 bacterium]|nr:DoxX family membrane protein [candidate division WS1 bacterium]